MVEGKVGYVGGIMIGPDGSGRAFGKFIGGCLRSRVDGFEGEERSCLNSREMLWIEDNTLITATVILREECHRPCRAKMPAPRIAIPIDILLPG